MKILYTFASRSRPSKFLACIENIYINSKSRDFVILASLDTDDKTMNNPDMIEKMKRHDKLFPIWGTSTSKIDAINRTMVGAPEFDILVNWSDDMVFIKQGYDQDIKDAFRTKYPERPFDLDQLIHFPDQHQGRNCMTMYIAGRKYYERDNFIYDPRCKSLWSDIIAQETGQMRGKYKFVNEKIFNHLHPSFMDVPYDDQSLKTESREMREHDYAIYREAKKVYDPENILPLRNP